MSHRSILVFFSFLYGVGMPLVVGADLTPPPGAPEATMKTLDEVEPRIPISEAPFTITESGSYYFTRSLTGAEGENGITIQEGVDNVTIDLMGYTLEGVEGSLNGIWLGNRSIEANNIRIRNGSVKDFGESGIALYGGGLGRVIEELSVSDNKGHGIRISTAGARIRECSVSKNGGGGIWISAQSVVESCLVARNESGGIIVGRASQLSNSTVVHNEEGVTAGIGSQVRNVLAKWNNRHGIWVYSGSRVWDCTSSENGANGIFVTGPGGIPGIGPEGQRAVVVDNIADGNEGAGIAVQRMGARIESNHLSRNRIGIEAESTGNFIVKNSAAGNTEANYEIVEGNEVGPIGTMAGVGHHPWANFSFGEPEKGEENND